MALVELENVTKRFGPDRSPATDGLSFTVESGRILALLGPSGCGKTTTLRLIAGFETPDQGRIAIAGRTVADAERGIHVEPEARGVGVVFLDYALFPHLTTAQNVGFGLERTAPEVFSHTPAPHFVAELGGAADFLPGLGTARGVVTEIGVFANPTGRGAGARVSVMIRPDDVTFVPDPAGDAVIVRRYFRGSENLYCLGLPSGHRVHSSQPSSAAYPNGLRVRPQAQVLHVVTFPACRGGASRPSSSSTLPTETAALPSRPPPGQAS